MRGNRGAGTFCAAASFSLLPLATHRRPTPVRGQKRKRTGCLGPLSWYRSSRVPSCFDPKPFRCRPSPDLVPLFNPLPPPSPLYSSYSQVHSRTSFNDTVDGCFPCSGAHGRLSRYARAHRPVLDCGAGLCARLGERPPRPLPAAPPGTRRFAHVDHNTHVSERRARSSNGRRGDVAARSDTSATSPELVSPAPAAAAQQHVRRKAF